METEVSAGVQARRAVRDRLDNRGVLVNLVFAYAMDETNPVQIVNEYVGEPDLQLFIVLDLDGTLVADDTEYDRAMLRPGIDRFFTRLDERWPGRLAVFTADSAFRKCLGTDLFVHVWTGERAREKILQSNV